ncbi:MAG: NADH-quinone oxidoreductase subunit NuoK [candidate division KSB1 bacterium]|nr:NADH-quinone oxidoreductase subunit NuoK [candidate division KSB1 bacterium]MDZ7400922.1 NADH-quinone oxidoreductase subunit NuoK [candidate division KSB1 bacterium]
MSNPLTDFIFGTGGFFTLSIVILLFAIGSVTFLFRRTLLHMLMAVELMLNAVNLSLIYFSRVHQNHDGQIFSLMIFVVAACEVALGIAIIVHLFKRTGTISVDAYTSERG